MADEPKIEPPLSAEALALAEKKRKGAEHVKAWNASLTKYTWDEWAKKKKKCPVNHTDSAEWLYMALGVKNVVKEDAPNPGIWAVFKNLKKDFSSCLKFQLEFLLPRVRLQAKVSEKPDNEPSITAESRVVEAAAEQRVSALSGGDQKT